MPISHEAAAEAIVNLLEYVVDAAPSHEEAFELGGALFAWAEATCEVIPDLVDPLENEAASRNG